MKLTKLHLTNYRGANDLSIDLDPKLNVFIGTNGTGKSTILDSAALMLSWVIKRIENPKSLGWSIPDSSISNKQNFASIEITAEDVNKTLTWKLYKNYSKTTNASKENSDFTQLKNYTESIRQQLTEQKKASLTLFAYYPISRFVHDISLKTKTRQLFYPFSAYNNTLNNKANFKDFFEWFREQEDAENESRIPEEFLQQLRPLLETDQNVWQALNEFNASAKDRQLTAVRTAICQFMPQMDNLRVCRKPRLYMAVDKNDETLNVAQLSQGEKSLMALVGDIARRLAILNPALENPLAGDGIVLIDEIDLHLHPQWQRRIIPILLDIFPDCQFLITTHSPHVITHIQPENLQILEQTEAGIKVKSASESYGKTAEKILEDLMGLTTTRPLEIEQSLQEIYQYINQADLVSAKQKLDQLRQNIKSTTDPELTRLELQIQRFKQL